MRCSSCEPLLDRYLEGTLSPLQMRETAKHLHACSKCSALLDELKIVDALLFTTATPELPRNFTFKVMAETFSMPLPKVREHRIWSFVALYLTAAWVAAVAAMIVVGVPAARIAGAIGYGFAAFGHAIGAGIAGVGHGGPALAAFGAGVLFLDLAIAAGVAALYLFLRPRLAAQLATIPEDR